jgi:Na+/proline symporter
MIYVSFVQIVVAIMATVGLTASYFNLVSTRIDLHRWEKSTIPQKRFMTRMVYVSSLLAAAVAAVVMAVSVRGFFGKPPPADYSLAGWFATSALITWRAVLGVHWHRKMTAGDYNGQMPAPPTEVAGHERRKGDVRRRQDWENENDHIRHIT